jgi:arylsulfatase A-like enzyme
MHARWTLGFLCTALAACAPDAPPARPAAPVRPPNVLLVLLDTLRPDHLGCYGSPRPTSPRLDALAQRSALFEHAQSAAPLTVASLLTLVSSLYPEVHGVQGAPNPGRMSEHVTTLAEVLAGHGYATAAFTEGGYANPQFGLGQGFQTFPAHPDDRDANVSNLLGTSRLAENLERASAWLKSARDKPFFLFFHTYEVHQPNFARPEYLKPLRPGFDEAADHARAAAVIERWNREHKADAEGCQTLLEHLYQCPLTGLPALSDPDGFAALAHGFGCAPGDAALNEKLLALLRDLYDAALRYTDDQLERLWQTLEELQLAEDTIVVVVSDHGEGLGEHGELEHSNQLHEEALHVALLIHAPGKQFAPRRIPEQVRTVDVMPTLLELVGIGSDGLALQGRSLVPLMRGEKQADRVAFSHARRVDEHQNPQFTVSDGAWRLIDEPKAGKQWLYDRLHDPRELADVAAQHPDVVARLAKLLERQAQQDAYLREKIGSAPGELVIDEKTLKELQALGYAGKGSK